MNVVIQATVSKKATHTRKASLQTAKYSPDKPKSKVDILVNSAPLYRETSFPTNDHSDGRRVAYAGVKSSYFCANVVAPGMLARGEGESVNITDLDTFEPSPDFFAPPTLSPEHSHYDNPNHRHHHRQRELPTPVQ